MLQKAPREEHVLSSVHVDPKKGIFAGLDEVFLVTCLLYLLSSANLRASGLPSKSSTIFSAEDTLFLPFNNILFSVSFRYEKFQFK